MPKVALIGLPVLLVAVLLCGCLSQPASVLSPPGEDRAPPAILRSSEYEVAETLALGNKGAGQPSKQNVWMALIWDVSPTDGTLAGDYAR